MHGAEARGVARLRHIRDALARTLADPEVQRPGKRTRTMKRRVCDYEHVQTHAVGVLY
jgi:hypothetical protein